MDGESAERFILTNEEVIKRYVNLVKIVPKLYCKQLITADEREELLHEPTPPPNRKTRLVTILSGKGEYAPRTFINCLHEEKEHIGHSKLADILRRNLTTQYPNYELESGGRQNGQAPHATLLSATPFSGASASSSIPVLPDPSRIHCASSSQGGGQYRCDHGQSSVMVGISSSYHDRNPRIQPTLSEAPVTNSLDELGRTSPDYANLILGLSADLHTAECTFDDVRTALLTLLENDAVPIQLPPSVSDFPSLCLHLRRLKMCHETDVDLLSMLFDTMQLQHLKQIVKDYANRLSTKDVMQQRYERQSGSIRGHFIAFTFHNTPTLTFAQACEIKHQISELLHIHRHTFTLVGYEPGSIGLAWQIPTVYLKNVRSTLEEEHVRATLMSSKYQFELIELEVEETSEREVVFTRYPSAEGMADVVQCSPTESTLEEMISSTTDEPGPSSSVCQPPQHGCKSCILYK